LLRASVIIVKVKEPKSSTWIPDMDISCITKKTALSLCMSVRYEINLATRAKVQG